MTRLISLLLLTFIGIQAFEQCQPVQTPKTVIPVVAGPEDSLGLIHITGGTFLMGSSENEPDRNRDEIQHQVTVADFYIGKYEVTQELWQVIMGNNPSSFRGCNQCPVEHVSWEDVQIFISKLNTKYPGNNYRLPTESEWEYAAKGGGKAVLFGNGKDTLDPVDINFNGNAGYKKSYSISGEYRNRTVPVGSLNSPNALNLHDMSGNVWEWCSDWYSSDYYKNSQPGSAKGPDSGCFRVIRGGAWNAYPFYCRVAFRFYSAPGNRRSFIGFRLARSK